MSAAEREAPAAGKPWFVIVGLWSVSGVVLLTLSFALARDNVDLGLARVLLWGALAAIVGPALMRILSPSASRSERVLLVGLTALLLYWIKVLHEPAALLFADEFAHLANTEQLTRSGALYADSFLAPGSADYPGLALVTAALSELSGVGLFTSALVVVGLAKVTLCVALFAIFERLSGSDRIAAVAALLYGAHASFLFAGSQFSYESLSLALLAVALLCVVQRRGAGDGERIAWTVLGCIVAIALVMTHNLTAYVLIVLLWAHAAITAWRRPTEVTPPLAMAVTATVAAVAWAGVVAGDSATRFDDVGVAGAPFAAGGRLFADGQPLDDVALALASVVLVVLAVVAGVLVARRRSWRDPLALLLALMAVAAVVAYPLRALPEAWEIASLPSASLFVGVALLAGVAAVWFVDGGRRRRIAAVASAGVLAIAGGAVLGWPANARLPRPFTAEIGGATIQAQPQRLAQWARSSLARDSVIVADPVNGRLLGGAGFRRVLVRTAGVAELLSFDVIPLWQWEILREPSGRHRRPRPPADERRHRDRLLLSAAARGGRPADRELAGGSAQIRQAARQPTHLRQRRHRRLRHPPAGTRTPGAAARCRLSTTAPSATATTPACCGRWRSSPAAA